MPDEATRSHPQEVQIEVEFDQGQPTICGGRGHRDGATNPSASPGKTHLSNRVGRSPRPHRVGVARLQQIAKILGGKAGRTFDYAAVNENKVSRRHNRKRLPDSGFDEDTECGLLRVPLDIIDQRFSLLDCHCSTYRRHTRLLFSITKSDFPSPTTLKQLNDGVFYSFIFHKISSA